MDHIDAMVFKRTDTRIGMPCEFCLKLDPNFKQRRPMDQIVVANRQHSASAHLTEDGYVHHRRLELARMVERHPQTAA